MTRFEQIAEELKAAAAEEHFSMPETLEECATAYEENVTAVIRKIREGADPLPYARFFDVLYTYSDVSRFTVAFSEAAPDGYIQNADIETDFPWCLPWQWESSPLTAGEGDTPESLAKAYVAENAAEISRTFREWKEQECSRIMDELIEVYYRDKELSSDFIRQGSLFDECFDKLRELEADKPEGYKYLREGDPRAQKIMEDAAEEIFNARA